MNRAKDVPATADFFARLSVATRRVLLLDYDGTIAPFHVRREEAVAYPGVLPILDEIVRERSTRMVFITGRSVKSLLPLLDMGEVPEVWGAHGWEHRPAGGETDSFPLGSDRAAGLREATDWIEALGLSGQSERKIASATLHWRGLSPERGEELNRLARASWEPIAARAGLEVIAMEAGLEIRAPDRTKGTAVEAIVNEEMETGIRVAGGIAAAYLGDDTTDEDAFRAISRFGGLSVLVREDSRPSNAEARITPPGELIQFLETWRDSCRS